MIREELKTIVYDKQNEIVNLLSQSVYIQTYSHMNTRFFYKKVVLDCSKS